MNEKTSLDLFYVLRDTMPSNMKIRKLSASYEVDKSSFHIEKMRMELGLADTLKLKRNSTIQSKESEIHNFAEKYKQVAMVPNQRSSVNDSMGLLLEKMTELHKQDMDTHKEDQRKMQLLHEEDQRKMQLIQENAQLIREEDQLKMQLLHEEDERMMQLMQENAQALNEEEKRMLMQEVINLRKQGEVTNERMKEEMNRVVVEMSIIMMCCMIFALAVLYQLRL
jgi:hypothetical protein